ncbi:MAG: sigma-54-dependent Fis family transcriptional regulator [Acidobacteria bacterium]|nr:sigma-54-dependent Fis family transcriptional regulator [Acidobacteriota bacterium]
MNAHHTHAHDAARPAWPVELAGGSPAARRLRERARELARSTRPVLILAPPGFDGAAVARGIHAISGTGGPLLAVACGVDDPPEVEARLFGVAARRGRAELLETVTRDCALVQAQHGTLVLGSVHELPVSAQTRLARALRDGEVRCVNGGAARAVRLDVRIAATTELSLERLSAEVLHGRFRGDLFKRFATRHLELVPLRDRREDIAPMALALMERAACESERRPRDFTHAALALISALGWDGNLAALDDLVHALAAAGIDGPVRVEDVLAEVDPGAVASVSAPRVSLREARRQFEREYIAAVLKHSGWRMGPAARVLGIQRTNLYRKARQLGITRAKAGE